MNLKKILTEAEVRNAHIIDDAYNVLPTVQPEQGTIQSFIDALDLSQLEYLHSLLGLDSAGEEVMVQALGDHAKLAKIFEERVKFAPHTDILFDNFLTEQNAKKEELKPLLQFLEDHGVQYQTFGADYILGDNKEPQLMFIDLRLSEAGPVHVQDAVEVYNKLRQKYEKCQPFVFLMSTLEKSLSERRDEFREKAELFASQFEAVPKSQFNDRQELESIFGRYIRVLPRLHNFYDHIDRLTKAMQQATINVRKSIHALDLADYFVLHRNTVSIEKVGLGVYISDLLLDYVAHEIESMQPVWDFAKDLDQWEIKDLPRSRFTLSSAARKIYAGNVLHSNVRLESEIQRELGPTHGYFYLGDIFFSKEENDKGKLKTALVVVTPACDLVRPEELKKRTILLCEGRAKVVTTASVPASDSGVAAVVMPHPEDKNKHLLINWDKKRLRTWRAEDMSQFATPEKCNWIRVARLRPLYATQLQHTITADLSRIGLQRAPDVLVPHGVEVFVRGDAKWQQILDSEDRNDANAAALSDSGDHTKQTVYILSDPTVRKIVRNLRTWLAKNHTATARQPLEELLNHPKFDQQLMYFVHKIDGNQSSNITGYPMNADNNFPEESKQAVAFVRPAPPLSTYSSVSGGRPLGKEQMAVLVVKFIKIDS